MYQTVLKSVNGYTAIGANGEKLQFVGNWHGSAGDTVWTDGNIIFGHSPLRASSTMMMLTSNSGIPVLCNNRRGYFSTGGTWADYDVAQYDWIVNNQNIFYGNSAEYNGATVFDAEISNDNNIYIVTWNNVRGWTGGIGEWNYDDVTATEIMSEYPVNIYKDGKIIDTIDLAEFGRELENESRKLYQAIKNTINETDITGSYQDTIDPFVPSNTMIVEIQSVNVTANGAYDYYVFGSVLNTIEEYIKDWNTPSGMPKIHRYGIPFIYSFLYHIENGIKQKIAYHSYGTRIGEEGNGDYIFQQNLDDGSFIMNKYGLISLYDSDSCLIAKDIVVDENFCHIEITSYTERVNDENQNFIVYFDIYTPDGNVISKSAQMVVVAGRGKYDPNFPDLGIPIMEGFFLKDEDGILRPFYFKPILKKLSDNIYLFGTHGGKLYIKTASGIQEVGDGLKNFRLELLNDISKARG